MPEFLQGSAGRSETEVYSIDLARLDDGRLLVSITNIKPKASSKKKFVKEELVPTVHDAIDLINRTVSLPLEMIKTSMARSTATSSPAKQFVALVQLSDNSPRRSRRHPMSP